MLIGINGGYFPAICRVYLFLNIVPIAGSMALASEKHSNGNALFDLNEK